MAIETREQEPRYLFNGAQAIALGAKDAGCQFMASYPITPVSEIAELIQKSAIQHITTEDEIAAMASVASARLAGKKAMIATSGPGLALATENLGWALMNEVPLVFILGQRLGPSTGGATLAAQQDIMALRWSFSGIPSITLAPKSPFDCYKLTRKAFEFAEKYRVPVFLATDAYTLKTSTSISAGKLDEVRKQAKDYADSDREIVKETHHLFSFDPPEKVSPLIPFGGSRCVRFTGSSHGEDGLLTNDPEALQNLINHFHAKIEKNRDRIALVDTDIQEGARTLVISFGSPAISAQEAVRLARSESKPVSSLVLQTIWPVCESSILAAMDGVDKIIIPEMNMGQYFWEIQRLAGFLDKSHLVTGINRANGQLITPEQILTEII